MIAVALLLCLFLTSVFKNISYPLFWADESITAIGTERVLHYGYPKVHDGKNVFYDLRHSNPTLGINEKDDAYAGGTGWAHYYYGIIGYKLAEKTVDLYLKTGIYRATYAVAGIIGLFLFGFFISRLFPDQFSRYAFISFFLLFELMSVSLALLLREVRYYSLVLLLSSLILGLYSVYRFYQPFNKILLIGIMSLSLWLLFNTFATVYFIMIGSIGLMELIIAANQYQKSDVKTCIKNLFPVVFSLILSMVAVYPLLSYFKIVEISKAMNEFNGYNTKMYWNNVYTVFNYFQKFELLWLAMALKSLIIFNAKKIFTEKTSLFRVSGFLTLLFIIFLFTIARIPNFIYTRYIIYLQPVLSVIIILDFFTLLKLYSHNSIKLIPSKMMAPILIFSGLFIYNLSNNFKNIKGHVYELSHQYKGPLDYTIPYIKEKYPKSDTLVIAANYEETSYMYYLKSKVIIGYTGNNLREDSIIQPYIIAYRKPWGNYVSIFERYLQNVPYESIKFPIKDNPVNNIPELNFMPAFNHQFETLIEGSDTEATYLYIRK